MCRNAPQAGAPPIRSADRPVDRRKAGLQQREQVSAKPVNVPRECGMRQSRQFGEPACRGPQAFAPKQPEILKRPSLSSGFHAIQEIGEQCPRLLSRPSSRGRHGGPPVHLNIVNPNTTAAMTTNLSLEAGRTRRAPRHLRPARSSPRFGPASIEGAYDDAFAVPWPARPLLPKAILLGADAHVHRLFRRHRPRRRPRTRAPPPVVGIGEAVFHVASLIAHRFAVVTTLARSIPVIETNLLRYGLDPALRARARPPMSRSWSSRIRPRTPARASAPRSRARSSDDGAEAIVLGCAGMADLAASLAAEFAVPVIDGVAAAVVLAEGLAAIGLRTSKRGGYAKPIAKDYAGLFARFSPKG